MDPVGTRVLLAGRHRHARRGAGERARALLPAVPGGRSVRRDHPGQLRRARLLPATATDAVGNSTTAVNDYRVLLPATVTDPNGNRVSLAFDALGRVTATAVMGKASEAVGDALTGFSRRPGRRRAGRRSSPTRWRPGGGAGQRHHPDPVRPVRLPAHQRRSPQPSPPAVYMLARETHVVRPGGTGAPGRPATSTASSTATDSAARSSEGAGGAGPWPRRAAVAALGRLRLDDLRQQGPAGPHLRAVLHGHERFEFAAASGVSTVTLYDPPGRVVATLHPGQHLGEGRRSTPGSSDSWDVNDTVTDRGPADRR